MTKKYEKPVISVEALAEEDIIMVSLIDPLQQLIKDGVLDPDSVGDVSIDDPSFEGYDE